MFPIEEAIKPQLLGIIKPIAMVFSGCVGECINQVWLLDTLLLESYGPKASKFQNLLSLRGTL